ncbi:SMC domain protein [Desulfofundulus kuznetsovii DSM 6115]|uniref:Nuclease SbcCD subunit C n=1 Tax=Desulfofundulus kuznetsovii (strain DSM 6115 / VKM B-1805 / 17) TaxID=760568 RepID=A0AAU8PS40_DESK7|nr:SMC domain protein [Desulfofundulus kuznetsovii DSM 6115]
MKINRLFLHNFRNHEHTEIVLDAINILVGKNAAGKSSIKHAIEYLLTGRVTGLTDEAGRGAAEVLPRHGADAATVEADIEGLGTVTRSTTGGLAVEGMKGSARDQQEALCRFVGASPDVISAAINTGRFLSLPPAEQKALLFRLLGFTFTKDRFLAHIPPECRDVFDRLYPPGLAGGAEVFDRLEKVFRDERRAAKKTLKELETLAAGSPGESSLPPGAWENREQIRQQLADLKRQRDDLLQTRARASEAGKQRRELEREIAALEEKLAGLRAREEELRPQGDDRALANYTESMTARMDVLAKQLETLRNERILAASHLESHRQNKEGWQNLIERIKADERCPLGPGIVCTADRTAMVKQVERDLAAVDGHIEKAAAEVKRLEEEAARVEAELNEARAKLDEHRRQIQEWQLVASQVKQAEETLERFRQALASLAEYDPDDLARLEQDLEALEKRITAGEDLVQRLAVEESRRKEQEKLAARVEQACAEVEALEILVELFGPKGLRQRLLADVLDRLQARADERMQLLTGGEYRVQFSAEGKDGFAVTVFRNDIPRTVNQLSTSERLRLGVVMQDILNGLTGLGLMVIDDAETLDPQNKMALVNMLLKIRSEYETIIVLSALGETVPRNPGIPGLAMFLVEDGTVRPIPAPAAMTA